MLLNGDIQGWEAEELLDEAVARKDAGDILFLIDILRLEPASMLRAARALFELSAFEGARSCCETLLRRASPNPQAEGLLDASVNELQKMDKHIVRIVFTGHMIDAPGRAKPRFPASDEAEGARLLAQALVHLKEYSDNFIVYLSGACGGDLLFAETCMSPPLGRPPLPFGMWLPFDEERFCEGSVKNGGSAWVERFQAALKKADHLRVLPRVFRAMARVQGDVPYALANAWMLAAARVYSPREALVLAFWDGREGQTGGAADLIAHARRLQIPVLHVRTPLAMREGAADQSTLRLHA